MSKNSHNEHAPFWALAFVILLGTGLATLQVDGGPFWHGYVLDMTGPAWSYILFRGRFTAKADNFWTRFFTPARTVIIFITVCFGIELMQYFGLYESTFDPLDFLAYISILLPMFFLDQLTYDRPDRMAVSS